MAVVRRGILRLRLRLRLRSMTSSDRNEDLAPAQEKLEWVTPQISLMGAKDTEGKVLADSEYKLVGQVPRGPS